MADFKYKPLTPGEAVTADTTSDAFSQAVGAVNRLPSYAATPRGLGPEHVPSIIDRVYSVRLRSAASDHTQAYDLVKNVSAAPAYKGRWPLYGDSRWAGASGIHESGESTCLMNDTTATDFVWYQIGYSPEDVAQGHNLLKLEFDAVAFDEDTSGNGALIMFNVDFERLIIVAGTGTSYEKFQQMCLQNYVIFGIQVQLKHGGASSERWYTLPSSVRTLGSWADWFRGAGGTDNAPSDGKSAHWDPDTVASPWANGELRDVAIRTLLTRTTIDADVGNGGLGGAGGRTQLVGVRAVLSIFPELKPNLTGITYPKASGSTAAAFPTAAAFTASESNDATAAPVWRAILGSGQLSVIVLHAGLASDLE